MKADKTFDFYEFTGIVMPGAIFIFGLSQTQTLIAQTIPLKDMSLGSLGVFLILSYGAGHLVQTLGVFLEFCWWYWWGMPSDWIRENKLKLLHESQRQAIIKQLPFKLGINVPSELSTISRSEWYSITRQMYSAVQAQDQASRIDIFNGNYGLNRGLCVALMFVAVVAFFNVPTSWTAIGLLMFGSLLASLRMHRFGKHYARELYIQFLQLPAIAKCDGLQTDLRTKEPTTCRPEKENK